MVANEYTSTSAWWLNPRGVIYHLGTLEESPWIEQLLKMVKSKDSCSRKWTRNWVRRRKICQAQSNIITSCEFLLNCPSYWVFWNKICYKWCNNKFVGYDPLFTNTTHTCNFSEFQLKGCLDEWSYGNPLGRNRVKCCLNSWSNWKHLGIHKVQHCLDWWSN